MVLEFAVAVGLPVTLLVYFLVLFRTLRPKVGTRTALIGSALVTTGLAIFCARYWFTNAEQVLTAADISITSGILDFCCTSGGDM